MKKLLRRLEPRSLRAIVAAWFRERLDAGPLLVKSEVSIQSISKVFTMALVMEEQGVDAIRDNMGVDATGQVFNSINAVEQYKGAEMNAMVNPGAITATSMVKSIINFPRHYQAAQRPGKSTTLHLMTRS